MMLLCGFFSENVDKNAKKRINSKKIWPFSNQYAKINSAKLYFSDKSAKISSREVKFFEESAKTV